MSATPPMPKPEYEFATDCVCGRFNAFYGDGAKWLPHWAHDCAHVAPWIREWARRRLDGGGPAVVQPEHPLREEAP